MNTHIKPFDNIHFRRAVAYAINRDAITKGVLTAPADPQYSWYPKGILGYDPNICTSSPACPTTTPRIAKQELAMAMKRCRACRRSRWSIAPRIQTGRARPRRCSSELKAVGHQYQPASRAAPHLDQGRQQRQDASLSCSDWFDDYPDPQDFSDYLIETGAGENWGRYSNPTVDALFAKGNVERDTPEA